MFLRPEEDFETWVLYLTEFLVENDFYIQMFNDFDRLLQYYDENDKLPDPIEGYSYLFINVSANLIVQNVTELEIPDNQQLKEILQILSSVGVHAASLFAKGYEKFEESIRCIFSRKTPIYNNQRKNPSTNQILFCNVIKNFMKNDGLGPLFQVAESYTVSPDIQPDQTGNPLKNVSDLTPNSSNPANSSNSIINKVSLLSQLIQCFQIFKIINDTSAIKMINRIIPAFSAILRRFDKAKLRNTDSNGIILLIKDFIRFSTEKNVQQNSENENDDDINIDTTDLYPINDMTIITRVVLNNLKVVIFDILDFSMFCLKSDILEKQMMAANILKMLRNYVPLCHSIQKWTIKNQNTYFSLILNQKFNENVLAVLKNPYNMFIEFAPPTNEQLNALWNMTIKMNISSSSYFNNNSNNNSNSFSYSNFANSSGLNSPSNSGSGPFSAPLQNERDTYISFLLASFKSIGDERTSKFLDDILVISLPEQQQQQQQTNSLITRNFIDVLQIIASKSDTSISERIAHFIIDLLKDSNHQELAFTSIKEMTKDKGQSSLSIKQLLMNYCRSQLFASIEQKKKSKSTDIDDSVTRSLLEIMQCLIQNSYQKSKDVDEELINLVLYFLDDKNDDELESNQNSSENSTTQNLKKIDSSLIFDFVRTCCVRSQYNLTQEQFDKLWNHAKSEDFAYLSNIIMKRGISFLASEDADESIKAKLKNYDYSRSELNFVDFVSYFIFNLNKSKGIISMQSSNDRSSFPTNFTIKFSSNEVTLDGFEFLTRILTKCKDKTAATVTTTRIITFITRMPNQSQAAKFLLTNFLPILSSQKSDEKSKINDTNQLSLEESKTRICNLLYEYVAIEEENSLCLEDFNLRSHKYPSNKNKIRITIQSQQLNLYVKPSIKIEKLCMKVALRMGCRINNVCLIQMGRELNRIWSLKDYGIKSNCIMEVYTKNPQQLQQIAEYNNYFQNQQSNIYNGYNSYQNQFQQQMLSFQQPVPTVDVLASHTLYNCGLTNLLLDILREYNTDTIAKDDQLKSKQSSELVSSVWRLLNILETDSTVLEAASDPTSASLLLKDSKTPLELLYNIQCIAISIHNCTFGANNETGSDNENKNENESYEDDDDDGISKVNKFERYHFHNRRNRKFDDEEEDEEEEEGFDDEFDEIPAKNLAKGTNSNTSNNNNGKNMVKSHSSTIYSSSSSSSSSSLKADADQNLYVTDEIISFLLDGKIYDIGLTDAYIIILISLKKLIFHRLRKQMQSQGDQNIQNSQNQLKRFKLKLKSRFLKQNDMAVKLVNNILTKLEVVKTKEFKQTAVRLLHDLASFYPEETCQELFSENSKLSSLLLKLDPDTLVLLSQIFPALPDKPRIFSFLSSFLFSVDEKLCENFCKVICEIINEDCKTEELTKELCTRLKINRKEKSDSGEDEIDSDSLIKNPFLNGYCMILEKIFSLRNPDDITPNIDVLDSLIYYFVEDCDENTQESILNIIKSIIGVIPDSEKKVSKLLLPYFSIDSKQWNFDPRRYEKTSIYTGLKNLGATCYLNSIIQQLFMNKTFRSKFMKMEIKQETEEKSETDSKVNKNKNDKWVLCLQNLFARLQYSKMPFLSTLDFCNNFIFHDNMTINTREQQDASEFFQALLDKLPKEVSSCFTGKIVNIIQSDPNSETVRLENGDKIQFRKENFESFFLLTLEVKGYKNLEKSIEKYLEGEDLQYTVEEYSRKIDVKHFTRIEEAPEFFVIQLKRFEYDVRTWNRYKVNDEFEFPFVLNIHSLMNKDTTECFSTPQQQQQQQANQNTETESSINSNTNDVNLDDYEYELTGIVIHDGHVEGGHYYSFIKAPSTPSSSSSSTKLESQRSDSNFGMSLGDDDSADSFDDDDSSNRSKENGNDSKWYSFNDNQVEEISIDDLKILSFGSSKFQSANSFSPSAYILFYSKIKKTTTETTEIEPSFNINPELMKVIENENKLFMHNQCVFRAPVMNLIATQINDWKVVLSFILNVTIHSKQIDYSSYIFENFINLLKSPSSELQQQIEECDDEQEIVELKKSLKSILIQRQQEALQIILSQKENIKEAIFQCSTEQILKYFITIISKLIQVNDAAMSKDFIIYLCNSLKDIMPVWKQIPYMTALICDYCIQNKLNCVKPFCDLLINLYKNSSYNYIIKMTSANGSNNPPIDHLASIKEVDLRSVFKGILCLFDTFMTKELFYEVFDIYDAILRSQHNSAYFLNLVDVAIDHKFMSFDEFFEMIHRNNDVECDVIAKTVVIARDTKSLTKKLSLFRRKISNFDLWFSRILLRNLIYDESLRFKCIDLATATIFYLMVSDSSRIRNNAEYCVLGVFPDISPLEDYQKAEDLLDMPDKYPNDVYEEYFDIINKYDIITDETMRSFIQFNKQVVIFCNSISSTITKVDPNSTENNNHIKFVVNDFEMEIAGKQCGMIFANFVRVIAWIYARTKTRDQVLTEAVWHLFVSISKCGCLVSCNRYEFVRLFQTMQLCISKLNEVELNEFVTSIFPITFTQDKKLNEALFISLFDLIGKDIDLFLNFDGFKQTFKNFFKLIDRMENINKATNKIVEVMNRSKKFAVEVIRIASNFILSSTIETRSNNENNQAEITKITWQSINIALFNSHISNKLFSKIIAFIHKQIYSYSGYESMTNTSGQVFYTRPVNDKLVQIMGLLGNVIMNKLKHSRVCVDDSEIESHDDEEDEEEKIGQTTFKQIKEIIMNNASKFATMKSCIKANRDIIVSFCNYINELNEIEKSFAKSTESEDDEDEENGVDDFTNKVIEKLFSIQISNNICWDHFIVVVQLSNDIPTLLGLAYRYLETFGITNSTKVAFETLERKLIKIVDKGEIDYFTLYEDDVAKFIENIVANLERLDDVVFNLLDFILKKFNDKNIFRVFSFIYRKYCQTISQSLTSNGNRTKNKNTLNFPDDEVDICEDEDEEIIEGKFDELIVTLIRIMAVIFLSFPDKKKSMLELVHFNPSVMESWPVAAEEFIPLFLSNE